jgi:TIR domain
MSNELTYDVFLTHSAKDKAVVRPLAERLQNDGLKVWFDEWALRPGDSIPAKIEEGLERSRVLVLCMSANAFGSDWAQLEAGTFRFRDPLNRERRFIPLRLDEAPIQGSLAQFLYINWRTADRGQEYPKLLHSCRDPASWPQAPNSKNPTPTANSGPTPHKEKTFGQHLLVVCGCSAAVLGILAVRFSLWPSASRLA